MKRFIINRATAIGGAAILACSLWVTVQAAEKSAPMSYLHMKTAGRTP